MRAAFDPGSVILRLSLAGGQVAGVAVGCVRPKVAGVLVGQTGERAVALLPLLFSVCGRAQGEAARLALTAARGEAVAPRSDPAVAREIAGEHLWRLLLDWPLALDLPSREDLLAAARRRLGEADFAQWAAERLLPEFERIVAGLALRELPAGTGERLLPPMDAEQTLDEWPRLDADFAAAPTWRGAPAETGALARQPEVGGAPLLARLRARWREVLAPPARVSAVPVAPGVGRAVVDTARGMLMHEISLDGDRVADYVIVAPTEWNFQDRGSLAGWLQDLPESRARRLAPLGLLALDPCVPSHIDVG